MAPPMRYTFRFERMPDERAWRERLRDEVGARRARPHHVETSWQSAAAGDPGIFELESFDPIALVYAAKLCLAMGGEHVGRGGTPWAPPEWAERRWVEIPWLKKLKLLIGPTKLYRELPTARVR